MDMNESRKILISHIKMVYVGCDMFNRPKRVI